MADINEAKRALLAEWERERDELNVLIARLRRELGQPQAPEQAHSSLENGKRQSVPPVEELVQPGDFFGMGQTEATKTFLQRRAKHPASLQEIAAALYRGKATETLIEGTRALANLSSQLSRAKEEFISVARGRWGLVEWYPGRALKRAQKTADEEPIADESEKPSDKA
jgi:hypothetical protein